MDFEFNLVKVFCQKDPTPKSHILQQFYKCFITLRFYIFAKPYYRTLDEVTWHVCFCCLCDRRSIDTLKQILKCFMYLFSNIRNSGEKNLFCLQKNCNFVLAFSKNFIAMDPYLLSSQDNNEGILPYGIVLFYCYCILF